MTYSLCYSYINSRYFKSNIDIWANFVPGMIFFQSIFGYLVMCIIYKWSVDWYAIGESPPGLLNMLIYMFLSPGTIEERLYPGQAFVQVVLLCLALACVPIMLFLKPFYLRYEHNRARAMGYRGIGENTRVSALDDEDDEGQTLNGNRESFADDGDGAAIITQNIDEEHEEFEFSEAMIHQVIHTIGTCCPSQAAERLREALDLTKGRILPELRLSYGIVSASLGIIASSSTAIDRVVVDDYSSGFSTDRRPGHCSYRWLFLVLVRVNGCHPVYHGGHERNVAQPAVALGRGDEQTFYW